MSGPGHPNSIPDPSEVLAFWREAGPDRWFSKDEAFDAMVRERFTGLYRAAVSRDLDYWALTPEGALALTIALDQFPRNMFRGEAETYVADAKARAVAARSIEEGFDQQFPPADRQFFYLPFMHSEELDDQERSLALYRALGEPYQLKFAEDHADIIRRFGRFPHRNAVLGRTSTPEEETFLQAGGFSG